MTAWRYVLMSKRNIVLLCILIFSKCFQLFNCVSKACLFELIPAPTSLWASTLYELFRLCYSSYYLSLCTYYIQYCRSRSRRANLSKSLFASNVFRTINLHYSGSDLHNFLSCLSALHSLSILHETVELKIIPLV